MSQTRLVDLARLSIESSTPRQVDFERYYKICK